MEVMDCLDLFSTYNLLGLKESLNLCTGSQVLMQAEEDRSRPLGGGTHAKSRDKVVAHILELELQLGRGFEGRVEPFLAHFTGVVELCQVDILSCQDVERGAHCLYLIVLGRRHWGVCVFSAGHAARVPVYVLNGDT